MDISMKILANQVKHSWFLHQLPNPPVVHNPNYRAAARNPNYQGNRTQP